MALYTGKGDDGTTKTIDTKERVTKSSEIAEALGSLDELNSFLGVVKVQKQASSLLLIHGSPACPAQLWRSRGEVGLLNSSFSQILESVQQNIFTVSAGLAGAEKFLSKEKVKEIEEIIAGAEKELPPIKTFTIAGGTELATLLDFARTLARRAERRVVAVKSTDKDIHPETLRYLNRLSSLLFALARLTNLRSGIKELSPSYN